MSALLASHLFIWMVQANAHLAQKDAGLAKVWSFVYRASLTTSMIYQVGNVCCVQTIVRPVEMKQRVWDA